MVWGIFYFLCLEVLREVGWDLGLVYLVVFDVMGVFFVFYFGDVFVYFFFRLLKFFFLV